ncbi:MAG: hypothetical protein ACE5LB_03835 [Acidiferrobacterales bacterium]
MHDTTTDTIYTVTRHENGRFASAVQPQSLIKAVIACYKRKTRVQ